MKTLLKNWLIKGVIIALGLFSLAPVSMAETSLQIYNVDAVNEIFSPWAGQEAEITFSLNKGAYVTFQIFDDNDDRVSTVEYDDWYEAGTYTLEWDGEDDAGRVVEEGLYRYKITVELEIEREIESGNLKVQRDEGDLTQNPRIKQLYLTKESFDPGRETTYIVFELTTTADLEVTAETEGGEMIEELYNKNDERPGIYKIQWDGESALGEYGDYFIKVYAENPKGDYEISHEVILQEETDDNNTPNIYKDKIDTYDLPFNPRHNPLDISFRIDKKSDITVEIRDDFYLLDTVVDDIEYPAGNNTIRWDGIDMYGDYIDEGVFQYKIIAENYKGKDEEYGNFSVVETSVLEYGERCARFTDVSQGYKYCEAIEWTENQGIFEGYLDGSFHPNTAISRVEALKVILLTLNVAIYSSNDSDFGFGDVDASDWYNKYLRTALVLDIVEGYTDGTFKPHRGVSRAEGLKILLHTGKTKDGVYVPNKTDSKPYVDAADGAWYIKYLWFAKDNDLTDYVTYYYPNRSMTRGEMADMLYRYYQSGLTN
jgi:flagellar hook assembly protein FlgD